MSLGEAGMRDCVRLCNQALVFHSSSMTVCFFAGVNETLGLGKVEQVTPRPVALLFT